MSKPPRPRRSAPRPRFTGLRTLRLAAAIHPWRCAGIAAGTLLLIALIATTSLPMALAERHPALALALHPEHPRALLTLAREERARLTTATAQEEEEATARAEQAATATAPAGGEQAEDAGLPAAPADDADAVARQAREHAASLTLPDDAAPEAPDAADAAPPPAPAPEDLPAMRARIRDFAARILAGAPLEASAWRLTGDATSDLATSRQAMLEAVARSRRETVAAFWLMHQDYEQRDYAGVVRMADVLLRTRPALNEYTLSYLNSLSLIPEGREALAAALLQDPSWRSLFLRNMGSKLATSDAPLALFQKLNDAGSPPGEAELVPLLWTRMAAEKRADGAYNIWLQMLPEDEVLNVRPVNNLDFANDPTSLPFNWNLPRSVNAFIDFQRGDGTAGRVLRVRFGVGRVRLGALEQVTFLRPGSYRFSGEQKGLMSSKRGMVWQVLCYPGGPVAGQSTQLLGAPRTWRPFTFDITIPNNGRCDAQRLRLIHDSRSTSEQFASGEIQFQSLQIAPVEAADSGG